MSPPSPSPCNTKPPLVTGPSETSEVTEEGPVVRRVFSWIMEASCCKGGGGGETLFQTHNNFIEITKDQEACQNDGEKGNSAPWYENRRGGRGFEWTKTQWVPTGFRDLLSSHLKSGRQLNWMLIHTLARELLKVPGTGFETFRSLERKYQIQMPNLLEAVLRGSIQHSRSSGVTQ